MNYQFHDFSFLGFSVIYQNYFNVKYLIDGIPENCSNLNSCETNYKFLRITLFRCYFLTFGGISLKKYFRIFIFPQLVF